MVVFVSTVLISSALPYLLLRFVFVCSRVHASSGSSVNISQQCVKWGVVLLVETPGYGTNSSLVLHRGMIAEESVRPSVRPSKITLFCGKNFFGGEIMIAPFIHTTSSRAKRYIEIHQNAIEKVKMLH